MSKEVVRKYEVCPNCFGSGCQLVRVKDHDGTYKYYVEVGYK